MSMSGWVRFKYRVLLATLLLFIVLMPIAREVVEGVLLFHIFVTAVFVAGIRAVFADRRARITAIVLAIPAVVGAWTSYVLPWPSANIVSVVVHLAAASFGFLVVVVLLREVYREPIVTADEIAGVCCGYLLIAIAFGHLYCLIAALQPAAFHGVSDVAGDRQHFVLTYFSLITLTTVGYGDIMPTAGPARALAAIEAVMGQLYIAILVAELVGKRVAQALSPKPPVAD
jgi:hypothetical protein